MGTLENVFRMTALPVSVFLAVLAMWWIWVTYPHDQYFFLERILPFYSLYLTLTAICLRVVSGQVRQFLLVTLFVSSVFMVEMFLRVILGIHLI